jgi:hypothetical protein
MIVKKNVASWKNIEKSNVPMTHGDHPEQDKSEFLSDSMLV